MASNIIAALFASFMLAGCLSGERSAPASSNAGPRDDAEWVAVGPCEEGAERVCSRDLGTRGSVTSCYKGTQICLDSGWGPCSNGRIQSSPSPDSSRYQLLAITQSDDCENNPCDPKCQMFDPPPDAGIEQLENIFDSPFDWQTGSLSNSPPGLIKKGLKEPCATGFDCQFNNYCAQPVTAASCSHSKCQVGEVLADQCDPCVAEICAAKPECCAVSAGPVPVCAHDPCLQGAALVPACDDCVLKICAALPGCCSGSWGPECVAAVAGSCGNSCDCGAGQIQSGNRCYFKEEADLSWGDARDKCVGRGIGWDLAAVGDDGENQFINEKVIDTSSTWIGFTDGQGIGTPDKWRWSSGDPAGEWSPPSGGAREVFDWGADWKYRAENKDPGSSWEGSSFDDASWSSGAAQLGFGDGDETTAISRRNASYYFRKKFTLTAAPTAAELSVIFDDGFVAYINGVEVHRENVSSTSHDSWATASAENELTRQSINVGPFIVGENTIAVVVKEVSSKSKDVSFDARLEVTLPGAPSGPPLPPTYTNWGPGEAEASSDCASFFSNHAGTWDNRSCNSQIDSVCEGPPSTMVGGSLAPTVGPWTAIANGAQWAYQADGKAPAAAWQSPAYDDSAWKRGLTQIGFGDNDEQTTISRADPSYYFRQTITLNREIDFARISATFDDGIVVWVNGVEVLSRNISDTAHSAFASATSGDNEVAARDIPVDPFVVGKNAVTVMVKNGSKNSSDVSFDLGLEVNLCPASGCMPSASWDQSCIDAVSTVCDARCDLDNIPRSAGVCLPWFPNEVDKTCDGADLAVAPPCGDIIPVCNHGTQPAPAGIRLIHFPANSQQYPKNRPDQSHPQMYECFTKAAIQPGQCINVEGCPKLNGNREIMVNPPGDAEVAECSAKDNWSLYSKSECGAPACAGGTSIATLKKQPVDIIFVVDNSGSMSGEIRQIQDRIHSDFAQIIEDSGLDYQVIMVARYGDINKSVGGSNYPICIGSPLGSHDCSDPSNQPAKRTDLYTPFSADVESHDALCKLIEGFSNSDELASDNRSWTPVVPGGYGKILRANSKKAFVVITDDDVSCSFGGYSFNDKGTASGGTDVASQFDAALLSLSPEQFGTAAERKYVFHSIVAMAEYTDPAAPWPASKPINTGRCSPGSEGPGTGYQGLSVLTGGLRYPTCRNDDFNAIFRAVAQEVVTGAEASCEFDLANEGFFDPEKTSLTVLGGDDKLTTLTQVPSSACGPGKYYYEDGDTIVLCPAACDAVQGDPDARLVVEVGCATPNVYEPLTVSAIYNGECDMDSQLQWGFMEYDTNTPGDSAITMRIRAATTEAGLVDATWRDLATAQASPDTQKCLMSGPSPCPLDLYAILGGNEGDALKPFVEIETTLKPTSDGVQPPLLNNWRLTFSCPDAQ